MTCTMAATYETLSIGSMQQPATFTAQRIDGNLAILIYGGLNMAEPALGNHGFTIVLIDNTGLFAGANNTFADTPTFNAMPINVGDTCGGCLEAYGGMATSNPPSMTNPPTQIFTASTMMGTLTISTFEPTATANQFNVFGSFDNVVLNGVDAGGNPLNPPCTTTATKLNFFFRPTFPAQTVARQSDFREGFVHVPVTQASGR